MAKPILIEPINLKFVDENGLRIVKEYLDDYKQDALVSGSNIKTINGESILGSGDLVIGDDGNIVNLTTTDFTSKSVPAQLQFTGEPELLETGACDWHYNSESTSTTYTLRMSQEDYNSLYAGRSLHDSIVINIGSNEKIINLSLDEYNSGHSQTEALYDYYTYHYSAIFDNQLYELTFANILTDYGTSVTSSLTITPLNQVPQNTVEFTIPDNWDGDFATLLQAQDPYLLQSLIDASWNEEAEEGVSIVCYDQNKNRYEITADSDNSANFNIEPNVSPIDAAYSIISISAAVETDSETGDPHISVGFDGLTRYVTKTEVQNKLDNYYNKSEVDAAIAAAIGDVLNTDF